ncbi:MAG: dipeptide epimerase [Verrucomicrobiota bacterium]
MTDVREMELRLRRRWAIARGASDLKRNFVFRLEHEGVVGEGEAAYHRLYGEEPESVRAELEAMGGWIEYGDEGPVLGEALRGSAGAAVDMALLDWGSRKAGKRLGEFLDVAAPEGGVVTSYSIGIDDVAGTAERVREAAAFRVLKVKLGSAAGDDRERFEAVRAVTDVPIRVDANGGWGSVDEAAAMIDWLAERGVELVEQPLAAGRLEETSELRERSVLPLVADEDVRVATDVAGLAEAYDGINIKLMKAGGVREAMRMASEARRMGMKIMIGCMIESSLGIGAALHLASLADWIDLDGHLLIGNDPYEGIVCDGGLLYLPKGPGIGVQLRE